MKHALLAFAALAALACDDPAATTLAVSVLEHGAAAAHISCVTSFSGLTLASAGVSYAATKMQDGACLASAQGNVTRTIAATSSALPVASTTFLPRNETGADTCTVKAGDDQLVLEVDAGELLASPCTGSGTACARDVSAVCTGFNLEAFGVAP